VASVGSWYVLIEEDEPEGRYPSSTLDEVKVSCWRLTHRQLVEGGREEARHMAERLAYTWSPKELWRNSAFQGRLVFRGSEDSWLVEVSVGEDRRHARITLAELIHAVEGGTPPTEPQQPSRRRRFLR
jgi:hypothetical protein